MTLQHKSFPALGLKVVEDQGIVEAFVSVFGLIDFAKDRVLPGAFAKSLARKLPKGVWAHNWDQPVAKTLAAEEVKAGDGRLPAEIRQYGGLYIKGQFNLDTQRGREAFSDLKFGAIDEFSFGYQVQQSVFNSKDGCTDLQELDCFEWSPVLVGCNPATALVGVKTVVGAADLPLAARTRPWDASAADGRVREWAGATDAPNAKYARAFMVRDGDAAHFTSYHLPFADVIDGELRCVPRAVFAVAGRLDQTQISDAERAEVRHRVEHYYSAMRSAFNDDSLVAPWAKAAPDAETKGQYLGDVEADATFGAIQSAWCALCHGPVCEALYDLDQDTLEERRALIAGGLAEFSEFCQRVFDAIMTPAVVDAENAEPADDYAGSQMEMASFWPKPGCPEGATKISAPPAGAFGDQLSAALAAVEAVSVRASEIAALRAKAGRSISSERRSQIAALKAALDLLLLEPEPPTSAVVDVTSLIALRLKHRERTARLLAG